MSLGSSLLVTTAKDLDPEKIRDTGLAYSISAYRQHQDQDAIAFISVGNGQDDLRVIRDGKPVALASESSSPENSALANLTKALESKAASLPAIRITVVTKQDAEKIFNQQ